MGCWTHGIAQQRQTVSSETQPSLEQQTFLYESLCSLPFPKLLQYYQINHLKMTLRIIVQTLYFWFSTFNYILFCKVFFSLYTTDGTVVEWFLCPDGFQGGVRGSLTYSMQWTAALTFCTAFWFVLCKCTGLLNFHNYPHCVELIKNNLRFIIYPNHSCNLSPSNTLKSLLSIWKWRRCKFNT